MALNRDDLFVVESGPEFCRICRAPCPPAQPSSDGFHVRCSRCGPYFAVGTAWAMLEHEANRAEWIQLSGWCRDQQLAGHEPIISSDTVRESAMWSSPNLLSRADKLLRWTIESLDWQPNASDRLILGVSPEMGVSFSASVNEVGRLKRLLEELGYLRITHSNIESWYLTGKGRLRGEALEASTANSATAFIAMWFNTETLSAWEEGIRPAVAAAGYDPIRVDQIEHIGRIDDEIMVQIKKARFVVADFTGHRGGVYFEAGFAMGLGLPVFWTCRADSVDNLHFDIRQYNSVVWDDPADLQRRLKARIENILGLGPRAAA